MCLGFTWFFWTFVLIFKKKQKHLRSVQETHTHGTPTHPHLKNSWARLMLLMCALPNRSKLEMKECFPYWHLPPLHPYGEMPSQSNAWYLIFIFRFCLSRATLQSKGFDQSSCSCIKGKLLFPKDWQRNGKPVDDDKKRNIWCNKYYPNCQLVSEDGKIVILKMQ